MDNIEKPIEITCPECKGKKCGFCNYRGNIMVATGKDASNYLEIARAKYRINQ